MALKLLGLKAPCFTYQLYDRPQVEKRFLYNKYLIEDGRQYVESINYIKQFFYDPVYDVFIAFLTTNYLFYPGWRNYRVGWNAENGTLLDEYTSNSVSIFFSHWTNHISVGGFNKFYGTGNAFTTVREVDYKKCEWLAFQCNTWPGHKIFYQAIVNRNDKLVVGNDLSRIFYVYNYDTQKLLGRIASLWSTLDGYMSYESDAHFWMAYKTGQLAKINYQTGRHELITKVQDRDVDDIKYLCAFDTKRKRLAILRHRADGPDGTCRLQIEFYQPVPLPKIITVPVPVNSLAAKQRIHFSAHVLGDAGEGIAAQTVTAELTFPSAGKLITGVLMTGQGGRLGIDYLAPDDNATETLTISTEV